MARGIDAAAGSHTATDAAAGGVPAVIGVVGLVTGFGLGGDLCGDLSEIFQATSKSM